MTKIEKIPLTSLDIKAHQLERLKEIFPEAFTEGNQVDWEKLRLTLGEAIDTGKERYGMNWPGKSECFKTIQQPSIATLVPAREESVDFDTTQNLFIEGDNLEVLKLLQKSYLGKVKMIYIDPPYNTGNDFIYPDNYSESLDTYLAYTGQVDTGGKKFSTNTETDGRFHSKWINMMYPRLFLAKNLLREDGVIFISIDDAELNNLLSITKEIFGEENFVELIIWKKRSTPPNDKTIGANHDYILVFCKSFDHIRLNLRARNDEQVNRYKNPDNHPKGPWTPGDLMANVKGGRYVESLNYAIINPNTGEEHFPSSNGNWRFNKNKIYLLINNNEIYFGEDGKGRPKLKRFLSEVKDGITYPTIWDFVPFNTVGSKEMSELLGNMTIFDNPKPSGLLIELLKLGSSDNSIVLDFFAGSSSTAHAIFDINREDGKNRRYICVQIPEVTDKNSEARKAGFNTIADISKERVRRVIANIKKEQKENKTLFSEGQSPQDLGFKVFKLQKSNFKTWNAGVEKTPEAIQQQLFSHVDHISPEAEQEAILYELLLKSGFEITTAIEQLTIEGKKVFSIAEGELLICLEKQLTHEAIKAIAERKPTRVICLDEGFQDNDQLKTNAVQMMKSKGVVNFRTV
jgi:adenine-specific DNA-methyltransferase